MAANRRSKPTKTPGKNSSKPARKTSTRRKKAPPPRGARGARGEWVLITGASAGIGEALAGKFAEGGFDLVLVARSKAKLAGIAADLSARHGIAAEVVAADLSEPGAARALFDETAARGIDVDVLVNNAGVLDMGAFIAQETATLSRMITLNTLTLTELASHFVPPMAARRSGRVLNVASVAAFQPVPSLAVYAATKAFVLSLTESLAEELKPHGVSVTALCPGITETGMFTTIKDANEKTSALPDFLVADVQDVAQEGYDACMKADVVRVPGLAYAMSTSLGRAAPRWVTRLVAGAIGRQMM